MNLLTDDLPEAIEITGEEIPINYDYRTGLRIMEVWEDPELTGWEKQQATVALLYKTAPSDLQEACRMALLFLDCGETKEKDEGAGPEVGRLFSFTQDARFIFTGILQTHGVNLAEKPDLHWWVFCSLFLDLGDCFFTQLIHLRKQIKSGKATKDERQRYTAMREIVDLGESYSAEDLAAISEFERLLGE